MTAYITPLLMVVLAEMGDKTQLLAMTFAARYKTSHVLIGVLIGSLLNHGMAVGLGSYLGELIPLHLLGIIAGFLFLLFGILALRREDDEGEEESQARFGPIATVALSFFLGEMGDKTQLTTLTMAVQFRAPLMVLAGAVSGMMVANSPGILVGDKLLRKISPRTLKLVSAVVFVGFGFVQLYETLGSGLRTWLILCGTAVGVAALAFWMLRGRKPTEAKGGADAAA